MPCNVTGSPEGDLRLGLKEAREEATKVTQLLCELCNALEENEIPLDILSEDCREWWSLHKTIDAERKRRELQEEKKQSLKQEVYNKLTPEEREAIGLRAIAGS